MLGQTQCSDTVQGRDRRKHTDEIIKKQDTGGTEKGVKQDKEKK